MQQNLKTLQKPFYHRLKNICNLFPLAKNPSEDTLVDVFFYRKEARLNAKEHKKETIWILETLYQVFLSEVKAALLRGKKKRKK